MAKQKKMLPARKPRDRPRDDDSLLLRSAESLGRVIGALQRQLDGATRRLSRSTADGSGAPAELHVTRRRSTVVKRAPAAKTRRTSVRSPNKKVSARSSSTKPSARPAKKR
jgi:hypothetical protein